MRSVQLVDPIVFDFNDRMVRARLHVSMRTAASVPCTSKMGIFGRPGLRTRLASEVAADPHSNTGQLLGPGWVVLVEQWNDLRLTGFHQSRHLASCNDPSPLPRRAIARAVYGFVSVHSTMPAHCWGQLEKSARSCLRRLRSPGSSAPLPLRKRRPSARLSNRAAPQDCLRTWSRRASAKSPRSNHTSRRKLHPTGKRSGPCAQERNSQAAEGAKTHIDRVAKALIRTNRRTPLTPGCCRRSARSLALRNPIRNGPYRSLIPHPDRHTSALASGPLWSRAFEKI